MALHIQMSEEAELELKKTARRNKMASLLACLLFIFLGGGILYFIAIHTKILAPAEFTIHTPTDEDKPPVQRPVTQELSSSASSSSNVAPKVIVSAAASPVNMARVDINIDSPVGISGDFGLGTGLGGLGDGIGSGGGGLGTGQSGGSTLEGTFYDLKQTRNGASTGIRNANENQVNRADFGKICEIIGEFFHKNWNPSVLSKYYQSKQKLYASNFALPNCEAKYAPIAYQCADKVKAGGWVAIYRGKVRAPKSGKFRFVGTGDDIVAVRFNSKLVLETGWVHPSMYKPGMSADECWKVFGEVGISQAYKDSVKKGKPLNPQHEGYKLVNMGGIGRYNNAGGLGGAAAGTIFEVKEGEVYPIELLFSEVPGGGFGFYLLMEDVSDPQPKLDVFRTNYSFPNQAEIEKALREAGCFRESAMPDFNEDSLIWTAVP